VSSVASSGARPAFAALAAAAGVLVTVAGCSSSSSSTPSAAATTPSVTASATPGTAAATAGTTAPSSAAPAPSTAALPAATGQLTGTQLESVLLPESDFPAGFATPTTGPISSGGSLTSGAATYNLATISCATFIEHLGTIGFGETAMVWGSVDAAAGAAYDQLVYQFATPSGATGFVSGIQDLAGRCGSFKASANGETGTFSLKASTGTPVGGHPSVDLQETGTLGTSKVALDLLLSPSGVDAFGAGSVGVGSTAPPAEPAKETLVYELMKRQAAVAVLG